ncbi:hypothetical protein ATN89_17715 [Comamonas thiooxydans]|uniref:DUF2591 family protein n=1 Tax=Comamonas thiooxydans TaxID=363952 RepID=UPI0007C4EC08|nr:DUF2591 family protein [Comamonas thiooxydans]OAD82920.1 hypothetical protein ATN89_17715 [Comamonas thiooxydans]
MKTVTKSINDLNNGQLSWMIAKHVWPNDYAIKNPSKGVVDSYDLVERAPGLDDHTADVCDLMDKYKISTLWRHSLGHWWACCEADPADDRTLGMVGETRNKAAMRALLSHLEGIAQGLVPGDDIVGTVELPEVLQ